MIELYRKLLHSWGLCVLVRLTSTYPLGAIPLVAGKDTGFLIIGVDGCCNIVLDGSNNTLEWLMNFLIAKTGKFFSALGFSIPSSLFLDEIEKHIKYFKGKIIVEGHSRGGAIAQIVGATLKKQGYDVEVHTFGSPRVGGVFFNMALHRLGVQHYRVYFKNDLITNAPPNRLGTGWFHYGTPVQLPSPTGSIKEVHHSYGEVLHNLIK